MDWGAQLTARQELLFGLMFLSLGLLLEYLIDRWQARRKRKKKPAGKPVSVRIVPLKVVRRHADERDVS